jgi:hypothetical protein
MGNNLNQKIELARKIYGDKFLNEKFENKEDNKIRKEKLTKLEKFIYVKESGTTRKYKKS